MASQALADVDIEVTLRGYPRDEFLSRDEEQRIACLPTEHEDRWKLVIHNMQFVVDFAIRFARNNRQIHDGRALITALQDSMIASSKSFCPRGIRFISYAVARMRWAARDECQVQAAPVRLPKYSKENKPRLREDGKYYVFFGQDDEETCFDNAIRGLGYSDVGAPDDQVMRKELREALQDALGSVRSYDRYAGQMTSDPRSAKIIELYYDVSDSGDPPTLEEIGNQLGICKERVRQLKRRTLVWLGKHTNLKEHRG